VYQTLKEEVPPIKDDFSPLFQNLQRDPQIGDPIPGWNRKVWKIRVSSRDLKRGKSGAFRGIYAWTSGERILYPLFIYFKGEKEDISKTEIEALLKKLFLELEQSG